VAEPAAGKMVELNLGQRHRPRRCALADAVFELRPHLRVRMPPVPNRSWRGVCPWEPAGNNDPSVALGPTRPSSPDRRMTLTASDFSLRQRSAPTS
jgi:hypothetical protein